ncbi:hypothetical protein [Lentibacillus sp. CBA3610]|uniref:hypothetical protein n=1 Tax=Lentibacillus sp. CBA3610 TaxID=2518176 RepID=UPI00350E365F
MEETEKNHPFMAVPSPTIEAGVCNLANMSMNEIWPYRNVQIGARHMDITSLTIEIIIGFFLLFLIVKFTGKRVISQITPFTFIAANGFHIEKNWARVLPSFSNKILPCYLEFV